MKQDGLLLLNKPVGISSFDCIRQLRRITGVRKIGHTGTLDPAASGLMLMLFGTACKRAVEYSKLDKTYLAEITLGATSSTGDREGVITPYSTPLRANIEEAESMVEHGESKVKGQWSNVNLPTLIEVRLTLDGFEGEITQVPPVYSAIKINGQEAYKRARRGETVEMPSRKITVSELRIVSYEYPVLTIEADVSSGTYIRTLAADIGEKLGTGAYLSNLVRTRVGEYMLEQAVTLDASGDVILESLI